MSSSSKKYAPEFPGFRNDHEEKPSHSVPSMYVIFLFGFYMLLGFIATVLHNDMPAVIKKYDIKKDDWKTFSEESARQYLDRIVGDQARVSGTVHHFVKARELKWLLEEVTSNSNLPVHIDWQYVSGHYWLEFNPPYINSYNNVSNIIAVLEGESGVKETSIGTSVLVNCHYDSVPFAIGASDNGVFCASMVEILSKLSRRKQKFKHNIIFLFNGAEENVLMGSHGFLKHPWSNNIINVVNLDSAGMNGRPSVFQVTDPSILPYYRGTPRPTAQSVGQFLFKSGIIPSDTDFRIWRDFGNITGLDMAFTEWGHVYHTRNDRPQLIKDGVIQHAGNVLMGLLTGLADKNETDDQEKSTSMVYYDYMTLFLISYTESTALVVDLCVCLLGITNVGYYMWLYGLRWSVFRDLLYSLCGRLLCIAAGLITVALLTLAIILVDMFVASYMQLRYLSHNWLLVPLYWLPYFISYIYISHLYNCHNNKNRINRSITSVQAMTAARLFLTIILFILSFIPPLSTVRYVITVILCMTSVSSFITMTMVRKLRLTGVQHLLLECTLSIPLSLFLLSLCTRLSLFFSPILSRSGLDTPDIMMAGVSVGLATVFSFGVSGIELLFSKAHIQRVLFLMMSVCVLITFVPITQYRGDVTQRHYWFHTQITTYNSSLTPIEVTSGVLIIKLDPYTVKSALKSISESPYYKDNGNETFIEDVKVINEECNDLVYCNLPSIRPRFDKFKRNSLFVKMEPPNYFNRSLTLVNKQCNEDECTLSFVMKGAAHNAITLYPYYNITGWSLEPVVKSTTTFKERPLYVIYHASNTYVEFLEPLEFNITLQVPASKQNEEVIEVSHHAHKIYNPNEFTEKYIKLLNYMPEYFNVATFLSFRDNYVF